MNDEQIELSVFRRGVRTVDQWLSYTAYPIVAGLLAVPLYWLYCLLVSTDPFLRLLKYGVVIVVAPIATWYLFAFLMTVPFRAVGGLIRMARAAPPDPPPNEPLFDRESFLDRMARIRLEREEAVRRDD